MHRPNRLLTLLTASGLLLGSPLKAEPVSLFDGKTLSGWISDPAFWRVEKGVITGGSTTQKIPRNDFIRTEERFQNFELKLSIRCSGDPSTGLINSGIQIRSEPVPNDPHVAGYQVDCGKGWFGKIYDEFRRRRVEAQPVDVEALDKVVDIYGWNDYRIRAEGPRIRVWINDVLATDFTETNPDIALEGCIAVQVHGGGICLVEFKDITVERLPDTPGAPTWESLGGVKEAIQKVAPPPKKKAAAKAAPKPRKDISYNNVEGEAQSAQQQLKQFKLPEGYEIELVIEESEGIGKFVSVYFDQRGRLWTQTALEYPVDANENQAAAEAVYQRHGKDKILVYPREALKGDLPPQGLKSPTVFAEGLAIPLGILPWAEGDQCYAMHGPDLLLLEDRDGDGVSDDRKVLLTGFGIEDSHLFPHQFTRQPGGWIWMAQGLFNNSRVKAPGSEDEGIPWPKCSMARMRLDGSGFEVNSTGPNNIWGLATNRSGETFIQEANDFGYPVMPFHEFAYYPGGMAGLRLSYQPEFPPAAEFRMGGTGLSGLALLENGPSVDPEAEQTMLVANPITNQVQNLAMFREGNTWRLEQRPDFLTCEDPFFRPVAMTQGPDGCLYVVDWYNKIISHNEVPRNHPDRDKTRGRIWRIKPSGGTGVEIVDATSASTRTLRSWIGKAPTARSHLAWQTLSDRGVALEGSPMPEQQAASLWITADQAATSVSDGSVSALEMLHHSHPAVRRAAVVASQEQALAAGTPPSELLLALAGLRDDAVREVRFAAIKALGELLPRSRDALPSMLSYARPAIEGKRVKSSRGNHEVPAGDAYDRSFERFLVRRYLEKHPEAVADWLDSDAATKLPLEARVLASLSLPEKESAQRIARLLPKLDREPNPEELLRLARQSQLEETQQALKELLAKPASRNAVLSMLLANRTALDAAATAALLGDTVSALIHEPATRNRGLEVAAAFKVKKIEPRLAQLLKEAETPREILPLLRTLRDLRSVSVDLLAGFVDHDDANVSDAAIAALASSPSPKAPRRLIALMSELSDAQRDSSLSSLSGNPVGVKALLDAMDSGALPLEQLSNPVIERMAAVLPEGSPQLERLSGLVGSRLVDQVALDGSPEAWVQSNLSLEGPFTVETWVRLDSKKASNADGILGARGKLDLNFHGGYFRVWAGGELRDIAVAAKPITPGLWTHIAVTRDAKGIFRIYQNGELDATSKVAYPAPLKACQIAWTGPAGAGTRGVLCEYRVWDTARTPQQILANFDRTGLKGARLPLARSPKLASKLRRGAELSRGLDAPPLLTPEQALALDEKFHRLSQLGSQGGDKQAGKLLAGMCLVCHQINGAGAEIGPELSGAGAMGLEAVLRNLITPNAAMEPGYRIFRVTLKDGGLVDAFFVSEDKQAIVVRQPGIPDRRILKADIASTEYLRRSLMPEGLMDGLNDTQAADLLAYLMSLK